MQQSLRLEARAFIFTLAAASAVACGSTDETPKPQQASPTAMPPGTGTVPPSPTSSVPPNNEPMGSADPEAYTLTLFAIAAPSSLLNQSGISWVSPGALVRTTLINEGGAAFAGFTRTIGHAGIEVNCANFGSKAASKFYGSQTTKNGQDLNNKVTQEQVGLGMMIDNVPGKIEPESALRASVDDRIANGGMSYVRFQIAPKVCHALLDYEKAYEAANIQDRYGLMARPLYREGAGCSAFSMAFLELANVIAPEMRTAWSFNVRIPRFTEPLIGSPEPLIGGTMHPTDKIPVARVSTLTRGWAKPQEEGVDLFGWDPTQMHVWIDAAAQSAGLATGTKAETKGKVRGLVIDRRTQAAAPELLAGTFFKN
jgi:hypothetical protein